MADSKQTATPSVFVPQLATDLAAELNWNRSLVTLVTPELSEKAVTNQPVESVSLELQNPEPVQVNAGAGRRGFPVTRRRKAICVTRLATDVGDSDEQALKKHWILQDKVLNFFVLAHYGVYGFISPIKYLGAGDDVNRRNNKAAGLQSVLIFEVTYVLKVEL